MTKNPHDSVVHPKLVSGWMSQRSPRTSELSAGLWGTDGGGRCAVRLIPAVDVRRENAEIGSLSEVTIGIIEFMGIVTGPIRRG